MTPPRPLRIALFVLACAAVLWGSLAPTDGLPSASLWDKGQHAGAYFLLALLGAWAFPPLWAVVAGLVAFGLGIEALQALMDFGREGDLLDAFANTLGALAGAGLALGVRRLAR